METPEVWRWIWLALGVGLVVGEITVAGSFFLLPFGIGALAAAVSAFFGVPLGFEWAVFVAVSAAGSAVLWPLGRRLDRRSPRAAIGATRWEGREARVLKEIPAGAGQTGVIKLDGDEWRAESMNGIPIRAGSTVLVSRVAGTRLIVLPLEDPLDVLDDPRFMPRDESSKEQ